MRHSVSPTGDGGLAGPAREGPSDRYPPGAQTRVARDRANELIAASFAPSTLVRYKGIWKSFKSFADFEPSWSFPASPQLLALYGVWLADHEGLKPSTVGTHLAGIGWWHKIKAYPDPSKHYLVKRLLIGLAKEGPPLRQATPLRLPGVKRVLQQLPEVASGYEVKLYRAAFLLAYYASLRVGEYARAGHSQHTLRLEDVSFVKSEGDTCICLCLMSFKASRRPAKLLVPPDPVSGCCPVKALKEYLRARPTQGRQLFVQLSGAPLTAANVNSRLRLCITTQGLPAREYSSHSFRAGRTTDLVEQGVPDAQIRESGRWRSEAYLQYVRFDVFRLPQGGPRGGC